MPTDWSDVVFPVQFMMTGFCSRELGSEVDRLVTWVGTACLLGGHQ